MNKIAIVTGGASGIGRAVAERFARDKLRAVILDINEEAGGEVAAQIESRGDQANFMCADVSQEEQVRASFDKIISDHGRIDVLVKGAGGTSPRHPVEDFPLPHWGETLDRNLPFAFLCSKAVIGI